MPNALLDLFEGDKQHLLNGRRCENQGLGIGAMAYYRRVIENQKNTLLDAIIAAARRVGASADLIQQLTNAKAQQGFEASVEPIKAFWPPQMLINGQSPLSLVHGALSAGLHAHDDAACQTIATHVRTVLSAYAKQLVELRRDDQELANATKALAAMRDAGKKPAA
jgi:hypothetical protein